jgi:hypothetical protein
MPNHMHAIIALNTVRADFTPAQNNPQNNDEIFGQSPNGQPHGLPLHITDNDNRATARVAPTIDDIIGAYKSLVANECLKIWKTKIGRGEPAPKDGKIMANELSRTYNSQSTILSKYFRIYRKQSSKMAER